MKNLSKNWLTEQHIDLEYKQYVLLAYLDEVSKCFDEKLLYPVLAELIDHYRNLKQFKNNSKLFYQSFKENLERIDMKNFRLEYQKTVQNDSIMTELEQIVDFSLPMFEEHLRKGKEIYDYVEEHLSIEPVGLIPLNTEAGYLIIDLRSDPQTRIYEYTLSLFESSGEKYRAIHTHYICSVTTSAFHSPQSIKLDLISENHQLPNPATYYICSEIEIPFEAAAFPVAKRLFMKQMKG